MSSSFVRAAFAASFVISLAAYPANAAAQDSPSAAQTPTAMPEPENEPQGLIGEPGGLTRVAIFADRHFGKGDITNGFYINHANMIPGAGWLAAGPGYRHWYKQDSVFVDASTSLSIRGYKQAQGRLELPQLLRSRLALGTQVRWQDFPKVHYFGAGPDTLEGARTEYRLRTQNAVAYATLRPVRWFDINGEIGWLKPELPARSVAEPEFVHGQVSAMADGRDFPGHPTRGIMLRVAASRYEDRDLGAHSFDRYESEAAAFLPLAGSRVVLALRGWVVASETDPGQTVPFYLLPSLGGGNTLRGYVDYRFHDRNMAVANVELRFALMTHMDLALFGDAGNVAADRRDLDLEKRSYGAGLRLHTRRETFAMLDVARGDEGWRMLFRLTDPLALTRRHSRRTATVPFVP
jgi:hypothetical protein